MIKTFLGLVSALGLLYAAAWLGAAVWLRASITHFAADLTQKGYAIERGEPLFVGFPTSVGLEYAAVSITAPPTQGAWRWQADTVRVNLSPRRPSEPKIDLTGAHRITGLLSAPHAGVALTVGKGLARVSFAEDWTLENIAVDLDETTVADSTTQAPLLHLAKGSLSASLDTGHATLSAHGLSFPHRVPVLSEKIGALDLSLDFTGPLPPGPLRESLEAWRADGGTIEVRSFGLDWPPVAAAGTATFALDENLQPMGAATLKFRGFFKIVAALTEKGYVREADASIATIVLGMLSKPSATGEPELSLPLTVQDRKLSAGPVALMEMPEVIWDENARIP